MPPYPTATRYPLTFRVDYPDKPLNRLTTFFRFLWIIPIGVIAALLTLGEHQHRGHRLLLVVGVDGILFLPLLLMILFRKKYPRWWFDWNLQLSRFLARVWVYARSFGMNIPLLTRSRRSISISPIRMPAN